jgi:purine-binding chemotaxis protein CheW
MTPTRPSESDVAEPGAGSVALLRMAVGDEPYALPISAVREILQTGRLTPVPRTPAFVRGVMNLRGAVVPVLDLRARLSDRACNAGRRNCIVVAETTSMDGSGAARPVGLLVDAVHEVFEVPAASLEPVPALGTAIEPRFLRGIARARGLVVGVLELSQVLAEPELQNLVASHAGAGPAAASAERMEAVA